MIDAVKYPDIEVNLSGENGSAFFIIARVTKAMKRAGLKAEAEAFVKDACACPNYDALLQLTMAAVSTS
jgi:hypothetical protein